MGQGVHLGRGWTTLGLVGRWITDPQLHKRTLGGDKLKNEVSIEDAKKNQWDLISMGF